jgi:two-component system NtrC family response regulator
MANILIIDDDKAFCDVLCRTFKEMEHEAICVHTLTDGFRKIHSGLFDVIYLDVGMPDGNGLEAIASFRAARTSPEIIIMTGQGNHDGAELAIRSGAWDYIQKPSSINMMVLPLVRALQYREIKMTKTTTALKREGIIGSSQEMRTCLDQVAQAASSNASVLIYGETGTGKELLAWAVHNNSSRAENNFVVVDCAALTDTLVESMLFGYEKGAFTGADKSRNGLISQADGGTLFLDEVGELPLSTQKAFLRVLQEKSFRPLGSKQVTKSDFRLISATNRNLDQMAKDGLFRNDLLFRLRSFVIEIAPLRNRREDVHDLARYYLATLCERYKKEAKGLSPDFLEALMQFDWPGNVRELFNTLERVMAVADHESTLFLKHLPMHIRIKIAQNCIGKEPPPIATPEEEAPSSSFPSLQALRDSAITRVEREYLQNLMSVAVANITEACRLSGLSRSRLYELLKKYGIAGPAK